MISSPNLLPRNAESATATPSMSSSAVPDAIFKARRRLTTFEITDPEKRLKAPLWSETPPPAGVISLCSSGLSSYEGSQPAGASPPSGRMTDGSPSPDYFEKAYPRIKNSWKKRDQSSRPWGIK